MLKILFFMLIPFFGFLRKLHQTERESVVSGREEGFRALVLSPSFSYTCSQALCLLPFQLLFEFKIMKKEGEGQWKSEGGKRRDLRGEHTVECADDVLETCTLDAWVVLLTNVTR